jgi:phage gp29-like protein
MNPTPKILGPDGQPVSAARVAREKDSRFNPLANWTPDILTRQLTAWARGEIAPLAWIMEWLETHDDVIATVAPKAKAAVSRHGWDIQPLANVTREMRNAADEQRAALEEFFSGLVASDAIEGEEHGGMRLLVSQVMDGYGKGYGAHHIIWRPENGRLTAELVKVPTWLFEVTTGRMKFLPSHTALRGVDLETMGGPDAWMTYRGRGVMLAACVARMFKQIPLQDWLTYCDRHGMPAFLGKTQSQYGTEGWTQMANAIAGIGSEFGAVVNSNDAIEVLNLATQGTLPYGELIDRMDRSIIRLWRGGDLASMSRENGVGANAQSEETDELDADNAVWVSEVLNYALTRRVIGWHFGPDAPVLCELVLRTKTRPNVAEEMRVITEARQMGVRISKNWFVRRFGIVEADEDEEALAPAGGAVVAAAVTAANEKPPGESRALAAVTAVAAMRRDLEPIARIVERAYLSKDAAALAAGVAEFREAVAVLPSSPELEAALADVTMDALIDGLR